jgi:tol-pal system protein YbgF
MKASAIDSNKSMRAATLLAGVAVLLLAGCAPQLDRIEVSVQETQDQVARLQAENKRLMQETQSIAQLLRLEQDAGSETKAMRFATLRQLSERLDQLLLKLDDNTEYMRDLSARVDLLATRSGVPTLGKYKDTGPTAAEGSPLTEEGRSIFAAAELDRSRGNIELARTGFQEFLEKFPESEEADDATYWLGDLAYGDGDFKKAYEYFEALLNGFPGSERVPAALYKGRACLLELGRTEQAWELGGRLLQDHPSSAEAALLKEEAD